jgi:hypothetical protein
LAAATVGAEEEEGAAQPHDSAQTPTMASVDFIRPV